MTATASGMLGRLAAERATGALLRDTGALYLADGEVVHAESPAAPGIDILLTAHGRLSQEAWRCAVDRAGALRQVGRRLVEDGRLTGGELELCHLEALFDAAFFVLAPSSGPTRFRRGAAHWLGPIRPVRAADIERETLRRRAQLAALWPYPQVDTAAVVPRPGARGPALTRRQQAVLDLADGVRTPAGIARGLGRPAFHTLVDVRRLAAAGYIETPGEPAPPAPAPLPAWVADVAADPDVALLRRLRDALEAHL